MDRKTGLFVGKFAPLHKGHQHVIETALAEVDKLNVLIYESLEATEVPLSTRAKWIKQIYPDVNVIEGWNGPSDTGLTDEVKRIQEGYVLKKLDGEKITHFFSSEKYGEHMSQALDAKNRVIDLGRLNINISASRIRANVFENKEFLDPLVYRDLITNVVFLGGPSTGKSTLCEILAKKYNTVWMPEYGREYWEENQVDKRLTKNQLLEIAEIHLKKEEALIKKANNFIFTDTNALTTYLFSLYYHNSANPKLKELADNTRTRYDLVFLCGAEIPYEDTWDRSGDVHRKTFQNQYVAYLKENKIPVINLTGNLKERIEKVSSVLDEFAKFGNYFGKIAEAK